MTDLRRDRLRGLVAMLFAVASFAVMDAGMKALTPRYPPLEIAALRGFSSLPVIVVWVLASGGVRRLVHVRWSLHLFRGVMSIAMLATFAYAIARLPLADTYSIFFVAPLLVTALAVPLLGERVEWQRWVAIVVGLAGVLIVLRPSGAGLLTLGGLAVLASALAYSLSAIAVRILSRTDSTQSMVFWMLAMLSIGAGALAWPDWVAVRLDDAWILVAIGASGAIGQFAITEAFRRAPASLVAPFEYTALAWGIGLDAWLWATPPNARMLLGAAVIIASGIYLIRREHVHVEAEHP